MKISKNILFLSVFLMIIVICVFFCISGRGKTVNIYADSEIIESIDLEKTEEYTVNINDKNTVTIKNGRVCMSDASCPDKLCVNQGWIEKEGIPIVCLPNKVIVRIE